MQAKAAEHLGLAGIVAENLRQLAERAQVIGRLAFLEAFRHDGNVIARLLADDPMLERMSLYDLNGQLLTSTYMADTQPLPEQWLAEFRAHTVRYGNKPYLPRRIGKQPVTSASGFLPFLLPLTEPDSQELQSILFIRMDALYLTALLRNSDLGETGLVRLLDSADDERLDLSNGGIVAGKRLTPGLPTARDAGKTTQYNAGNEYQSLYSRVRDSGFSVVVSQQVDEILDAQQQSFRRQLWMNLGMTLIILAGMTWMLSLIHI